MPLLGAFSSVTIWIIALCTAASLAAFQSPKMMREWTLRPFYLANEGRYFPLLTSGFIHADMGHLFFNMLTLFFFGSALENYYEVYFDTSGLWVAALFLSAVVVSSLPSVYKHKGDRGYATLGASGGVEAIIFASILIDPMSDICLYFALCLPGFVVGILYLGYSYYQSKNGQDYINHDAHLTGALYGLIWQSIMTPSAWGNILSML